MSKTCKWLWIFCFLTFAVQAAIPKPQDLPPYDYHIADGLYSTVVLKKTLPKDKVKEQKIKLRRENTGFDGDVECRVYWQPQPAPLAVVFVGLNAKAKDDLSRTWPPYLYRAGCHVMIFDSVFGKDLNKRTRHGVSGNPDAEARVSAKIIEQFLVNPSVQGRVLGNVHLLGTSYGGTIALVMNNLSRSGQISLPLGRILVLSPTISLKTSAQKLDRWYEEDLKSRSIFSLLPLRGAQPLEPGEPIPFSASLMQAGIAYVFRSDLRSAVKENDKAYNLNLLNRYRNDPNPHLNALGNDKNWSFQQYMELMAFPYWQQQGGPSTHDQFWALGDLNRLLSANPDNVHVIIAADDPLNDSAESEQLRARFTEPLVQVLPIGGHLGFAGTRWIQAYIRSFFQP